MALVTLVLGCSRYAPADTVEDVAASREQVRAAAAEDLVALADALGGTIVAARGRYNSGGDGMVNRQQYQAGVDIDGPTTTTDQVVAALEALQYDVAQEPDSDDSSLPVVGERDGLRLGVYAGEPPIRASISGPYLTIPMEDGPPPPAEESLDLPGFGTLPLRLPFEAEG